jgi:hypothetical protein
MSDHFSIMHRASSQSWIERMRRRGAGMVVFRPPPARANRVRWHIVEAGERGRCRMQFHPGIDVWRSEVGERFNAERCGDLGWVYIAPCDPEPDQQPADRRR